MKMVKWPITFVLHDRLFLKVVSVIWVITGGQQNPFLYYFSEVCSYFSLQ
jgi:hypothetical protein